MPRCSCVVQWCRVRLLAVLAAWAIGWHLREVMYVAVIEKSNRQKSIFRFFGPFRSWSSYISKSSPKSRSWSNDRLKPNFFRFPTLTGDILIRNYYCTCRATQLRVEGYGTQRNNNVPQPSKPTSYHNGVDGRFIVDHKNGKAKWRRSQLLFETFLLQCIIHPPDGKEAVRVIRYSIRLFWYCMYRFRSTEKFYVVCRKST